MLNDLLYFAELKGKYYKAIDCPECDFRWGLIDKLDLLDGPIEFECKRQQSGRGLCGAKWSLMADNNLISKMEGLARAHEALRMAEEQKLELAKEI